MGQSSAGRNRIGRQHQQSAVLSWSQAGAQGSFNSEDYKAMSKHDTTSRHDIEASNAVPSTHQLWEPALLRTLVLDTAKLSHLPRKVQQALSNFPKSRPVSLDEFNRQKLRLPYCQWPTDNGGQVLFNRNYDSLFIWPAGAERPERCDPDSGEARVQEGRFYSKNSFCYISTSDLHHALEALLDAWKRGDLATAEVLAEWLQSMHKAYQELIRACRKVPA
jgi:hypothetical protein